ncbi:MAG: Uma2 family endonuclease [Planctomycetes bacterium]|nr:Uma2 family endonuclease [Planctomycetota bacterium]
MASSTRLRPPHPGEVLYPESDGKLMADTDEHRYVMTYLIEALRLWFAVAVAADVYVSGNLMMYYVAGDTNIRVSPDIFVVKGVAKRFRRVYKVWEEGKAPAVVIEVSSRGTKSEDLTSKFELYRDVLKVKEYYVYDPLREYLPTRLRAWERKGGRYVERRVVGGRIGSRELGLELVDRDGRLRLVGPNGEELPDLQESEEARRKEAEGRRQEAEGRLLAEAEVLRLREELARLRREQDGGRG